MQISFLHFYTMINIFVWIQKIVVGKSHFYLNPELHLWIPFMKIETETDLTPYAKAVNQEVTEVMKHTSWESSTLLLN